MRYTDASTLPRRFTGPPLDATDRALLLSIKEQRAIRAPGKIQQNMADLIARGVLFYRPALIGDVISLGYSGCDQLGIDFSNIPSTDAASNLIYFRESIIFLEKFEYTVDKIYSVGHCLLSRAGTAKYVLMARATRGGYSAKSVSIQLKRTDIQLFNGHVIIVAQDCSPYARLASHHSHLKLFELSLLGLATMA